MNSPDMNVLPKPGTLASGGESYMRARSRSESCARIKDLGFTISKHIKMYGERFEIVSEPCSDGDCIAVRAISGGDPTIRTLRLPTAILVGLAERFLKRAHLPGNNIPGCEFPSTSLQFRRERDCHRLSATTI